MFRANALSLAVRLGRRSGGESPIAIGTGRWDGACLGMAVPDQRPRSVISIRPVWWESSEWCWRVARHPLKVCALASGE
jgi:hypothetical protein